MSFGDKRKLFEEDTDFTANNPLLNTHFFLNKEHTLPVVLSLTPKSVFFHAPENRAVKKGFMITFDTIFQILRPKYKAEEKTLGAAYGLKFLAPNFESQ